MIVKTKTGLMSRCYTLYDAYLLAKRGGIDEITVIWPMDFGAGAHFYEVFSEDSFPDMRINLIEIDRVSYGTMNGLGIRGALKTGKLKTAVALLYGRSKTMLPRSLALSALERKYRRRDAYFILDFISVAGYKQVQQKDWMKAQNALQKSCDIYIDALNGIIKQDRSEYEEIDLKSVIQFQPDLVDWADQIVQTGAAPMIGLHIRRGTAYKLQYNLYAQNYSQTETFIEKADKILEENTDTKFFLATDDPSVEQLFISRYGKRIITQEGEEYDTSTIEGVGCSVVDMLCLSKCDRIIGSYGSVFSGFAAKYGNKELEIAMTKPDTGELL